LGYFDLGCYGQRNIRTPNMDRMAAEGTRFPDCYESSAVSAPSRSDLMTGQHTGHTRIRGNFAQKGGVMVLDDGPPQRRAYLRREDITVAEVLKGAGYSTGITGKWGIAEPGTPGTPNKKGFDEWFGYLNQRRAHTYYPPFLWRNEEKVLLEGNQGGSRKQYSHDMFTEFALDFIGEHADGPFFLYLPYTMPHAAFDVPELGEYASKPWPDRAKAYGAMVSRLDRDIGRIIECLKEENIDGNTIIFLCSDNGSGSNWDGFFESLGPFRGHKGNLYEGGIRVPMIARWPGHIPAGVSDAPWYFADFLPTAAALAGAGTPRGTDGVSVLPALLGEDQGLSTRPLYWEYYVGGYVQAVRMGRWKAVRHIGKESELYNLSDDIGETRNVGDAHQDLVGEMEACMEEAHVPSDSWSPGE
jgi:arylsulfatase A-like enzyme